MAVSELSDGAVEQLVAVSELSCGAAVWLYLSCHALPL